MSFSLELRAVRKTFHGVVALDGAAFAASQGEVHALLGENGAGKSSLMNVAAGIYAPDAGDIEMFGQRVVLRGPSEARRHGVGMVHQESKLVGSLTVAENILLASGR